MRRPLACGLAGVCTALALAVYSREAAADYIPSFDFAVLETYTRYALKGQLLLGPYSRLAWHHPGPLLFYLYAPFYVVSGDRSAGLSAAAAGMNLFSLAVIVGIPLWMKKYTLAVATALLAAAYVWRIQTILASQWNPHILVLPAMALFLLAAASASGHAALLPIVAALSTFLVQTHVGLLPTIVPIAAVAAWLAVSGDRVRRGTVVFVTGGILLLLWLPPIVEQLHETPGNMTKLWQYFVLDHRPGLGWRSALIVWADMLSGLFRPDFERAWGAPYHGSDLTWPRPWAIIQLVLLAAIAARAAFRRDRFGTVSTALLLIASLAALWSVARINQEDLYDHAIFWMSAIGVLNSAVIIDAALTELSAHGEIVSRRVATIVCTGVVIGAGALAVQQLRVVVSRSFRPGIEQLAARRLTDAIEPFLGGAAKPLIRMDPPTWPVAAGVILQLQKDHIRFAVDQPWISMFTRAVAASGDETHTLSFVSPPERERLAHEPGNTVIVERDSISVVLGRR